MRALHIKEWGGPLEPAEIAVPTPGRVLEAQDPVGALEGVHQMGLIFEEVIGSGTAGPGLARLRPSSSCPAAILCCATAFSASSSASPCADPMCSISRDPRREDNTTCTAIAPDVVFTVRMYGTRPLYGPRLVRNFSSRKLQNHRPTPCDTCHGQIVAQLGAVANGNVDICVICASLGVAGPAVMMITELLEHG